MVVKAADDWTGQAPVVLSLARLLLSELLRARGNGGAGMTNAARLLASVALSPADALRLLARGLRPASRLQVFDPGQLHPAVATLCVAAQSEAWRMGETRIGTDHLLLAVLGLAAAIAGPRPPTGEHPVTAARAALRAMRAHMPREPEEPGWSCAVPRRPLQSSGTK